MKPRVLCVCANDDGIGVLPDKHFITESGGRVTLECWKDYHTVQRWDAEQAANIAYQYTERRDFDFVVIDMGTFVQKMPPSSSWVRHIVVDNHYLSARNAVTKWNHGEDFDDYVLFYDKDGTLSLDDVTMVMKPLQRFLTVDRSESISRAIDAGLFPRRQVDAYAPERVLT